MIDDWKIKVEEDTQIISRKEVTINRITALYELWKWESIKGNSLIFRSSDVDHLDNDELILLIGESDFDNSLSNPTFKRDCNGYCFVNFDFEVPA